MSPHYDCKQLNPGTRGSTEHVSIVVPFYTLQVPLQVIYNRTCIIPALFIVIFSEKAKSTHQAPQHTARML